MFLFIPVLALLLAGHTSFADLSNFEHLGAAPPGIALLDIRNESAVAPIQILGTVRPPTVLINGKPVALEPADASPAAPPGIIPTVWLNGNPVELSGETGRFFVQLTGASAAIPELNVSMRNAEGKLLQSSTKLNRVFLEAPISIKKAVDLREILEPSAGKRFSFSLTGPASDDVAVEIEGATVTRDHDKLRIDFALPLGRSTVVVRTRPKSGAPRIVNLPMDVRLSPALDLPVLSITPPAAEQLYQAWTVNPSGHTVRGVTNPGATLTLNGTPASVGEDGTFEVEFKPTKKVTRAQFEVASAGKKKTTFQKEIHAPAYSDSSEPTWQNLSSRPPVAGHPSRLDLRHLRLSQLTAIQNGGVLYSAALGWHPEFHLLPILAIVGGISAVPLRSNNGIFLATDYELLLSLRPIASFEFEAGGGRQTWHRQDGGTSSIITVGALWELGPRLKPFASYSNFLIRGKPCMELKLGRDFRF